MVFEDTNYTLCADGSVQNINDLGNCEKDLLNDGEDMISYREQYNRTIKKFAHQAYRTLLITYKDMSMDQFNALKEQNNDFAKEGDRECLEKNLIAIGIFGLQDPLRDGIYDSI